MSDYRPHMDQLNNDQISPSEKNRQQLPSQRVSLLTLCRQIRQKFLPLVIRPGAHTASYMFAAGFKYTGNGDTARCECCDLEVSEWREDMNPFTVHSELSPHCQFIRSLKPFSLSNVLSSSSATDAVRNTLTSTGKENPSKRQKIETNDLESQTNTSIEADLLQQARIRSFSHWPHHKTLSSAQMIEAGFFNCNVGDRVICIDCNRICHQWTPHVDDPSEVHKTISPDCKYVKENLMNREPPPVINPDESSTRAAGSGHSLRFSAHLRPPAQNNGSCGVRKPVTVCSTTPNDKIRSTNDLIFGGYFHTDSKAVETCSQCNKSLQNLGSNNDPMIKHAEWLLHCAHSRQLDDDDDELYHKTQESKEAKQKRDKDSELKKTVGSGVRFNNNSTTSSQKLLSHDERIVSRLIAVGFHLPMSQRLLDQNSRLSLTNRSLVNQLQIKHKDSTSDVDLLIACAIFQKQIDHIDGKKENIIIPCERMRHIRQQNEKEQAAKLAQNQTASKSISCKQMDNEDQSGNSISSNPCVLCRTEEKRLACIPCGHLATCVPCGHSLRSCPICRRDIEAFVRVYA